MRSAVGFQLVTLPFRSLLTITAYAVETVAARHQPPPSGASHCFVGTVSEHALCTNIPTGHDSIERSGNNRFPGRFTYGGGFGLFDLQFVTGVRHAILRTD